MKALLPLSSTDESKTERNIIQCRRPMIGHNFGKTLSTFGENIPSKTKYFTGVKASEKDENALEM